MPLHLVVRWTVLPGAAPRPRLHCRGCGLAQPFVSTGKVRLNANGRRLDAWLIYRCATCGAAWNRPIFERRSVREVPGRVMAALHGNEPGWLDRFASDPAGLARFTRRIERDVGVTVCRMLIRSEATPAPALSIHLIPKGAVPVRPDRLIARELRLGRARIAALSRSGRLSVAAGGDKALRRPLAGALRIELALHGEPDADAILAAARE